MVLLFALICFQHFWLLICVTYCRSYESDIVKLQMNISSDWSESKYVSYNGLMHCEVDLCNAFCIHPLKWKSCLKFSTPSLHSVAVLFLCQSPRDRVYVIYELLCTERKRLWHPWPLEKKRCNNCPKAAAGYMHNHEIKEAKGLWLCTVCQTEILSIAIYTGKVLYAV